MALRYELALIPLPKDLVALVGEYATPWRERFSTMIQQLNHPAQPVQPDDIYEGRLNSLDDLISFWDLHLLGADRLRQRLLRWIMTGNA